MSEATAIEPTAAAPSAAEHATAMARYTAEGQSRARAIGNRGPISVEATGRHAQDILGAYWRHGV
ncbi:MAG: hypothetical protein OXM56_09595, partial [Gammaproteobacteria bacterium]|nr:hypothetical protein [Gammaproteobacteria bacterium]